MIDNNEYNYNIKSTTLLRMRRLNFFDPNTSLCQLALEKKLIQSWLEI